MGAHSITNPGGGLPRFEQRGENAAALVAERRGARILARNWRGGGGELDLVLDDRGTIVFVEVKTRASATCGSGFDAVTRAKQRKITAAAIAFLHDHDLERRACRFDVLVVSPVEDRCSVEWLEDAFFAAPEDELDR